MCKAHSKVTHIKQQIYFYHLKGRGYNKNWWRGGRVVSAFNSCSEGHGFESR